jgi:ketosteroid isomerase-like protein
MTTSDPTTIVSQLYEGLEAGDLASSLAVLDADVDFHVARSMPTKTYRGLPALVDYLDRARRAAPEDGDIALEVLATDGEFAFVIHSEAIGTERAHRHVMVYRVIGDQITEAWELNLGDHPSYPDGNVDPAMADQGLLGIVT